MTCDGSANHCNSSTIYTILQDLQTVCRGLSDAQASNRQCAILINGRFVSEFLHTPVTDVLMGKLVLKAIVINLPSILADDDHTTQPSVVAVEVEKLTFFHLIEPLWINYSKCFQRLGKKWDTIFVAQV